MPSAALRPLPDNSQIMRMVEHCNIVQLKHCFYTTNEKEDVYLNLVLEYVPDTGEGTG